MDVNLKNVVKGKILFKYYRSYKKRFPMIVADVGDSLFQQIWAANNTLKLTFGILETVRPMLHRMVHQVEAVW